MIKPDQPICDFCSSPAVKWRYEAHDTDPIHIGIGQTQTPLIVLQSEGAWAACDICHLLIESGEWGRLVDRAVECAPSYMREFPRETIHETISVIQQRFRDSKYGPAKRLDK